MRLDLVHLFFILYEGNAHTFFLAMLRIGMDVLDWERKNATKEEKRLIVIGKVRRKFVEGGKEVEIIKDDKDKKTYQVILKSSLKRPEMPSLC